MNGKQVIAKLKAAGCRVVRIEGSHHILEKDNMSRAVPVPVHRQQGSRRGLARRDPTPKWSEAEMSLGYPYTAEPQADGAFLVQFVDLEEAFTEGDSLEGAAYNAAEVLSAILAYRVEHGQDIPTPTQADGRPLAYPSPEVQAAVLMLLARGKRPLSELARALNTSWPAAQRLEDPHHWPTLKQLDRAARVLGKRLVLSLE